MVWSVCVRDVSAFRTALNSVISLYMLGLGLQTEVGLLEHLKKRTYGIFLTGQIALYGMCC